MPTRLGERYRIGEVLGSGGMAVVVAAEDLQTGGRVAVKILQPHLIDNQQVRQRFDLEVQAARSMNHPHVVRFVDAGEQNRLPYLVMELVDGPSLAEHVAEAGPLRWELAFELVRQATIALEAMHDGGLVHRDTKPANLLLEMEGSEPKRLKVADLGLVRVSGRRITEAGDTVGTSSYMAPEQIVADPVDGRTDVYSLGITLFFALTGELPFEGNAGLVMCHQLRSPAPPPSWLVDRLDRDGAVDRIVASSLRKAPANRYPSMEAMRHDLERALGLRDGAPAGTSLTVVPDIYTPNSELGRNVVEVLVAQYMPPEPVEVDG